MTLSEELTWRGFVNQTTLDDIKKLDGEPITFYWGVDPSADSMQAGNLAIAMMIKHFVAYGHKPVLLVGGATGMIGDPDGKDDERLLLSEELIAFNKASITAQYKQLFGDIEFSVVDNHDWFKEFNYLDFLRKVGKNVPMSQMLGREFVQSRLGEDGNGISYAEFSYALIQGYDFVHLYKNHGVTMQVCGSDQWGNCIAGVELIRRMEGAEAHIWSAPLVMNKSTGKKFGKTEGGAVWLKEEKTSPFKFYQFWLNSGDEDSIDYLKIYTLLGKDEVDSIAVQMQTAAAARPAQKRLAKEVTAMVHGAERAASVERISEVIFGTSGYESLEKHDYEILETELMTISVNSSYSLLEFMVETGLAKSKTEARNFLSSNAIYINGSQLPLDQMEFTPEDFIHGYAVVRRGKNTTALAKMK
jgi:tyrosyl-tRNA synthetase